MKKAITKLSSEARELIFDLYKKGHSPKDIKMTMEDGAYLEKAGIPQEVSEEIHLFLTDHQI